jgi:Tat protein translocase TatB subunit
MVLHYKYSVYKIFLRSKIMFGLGMPEIFLILALALIIIGPKKLPDLAKTLGKAMGEFKNAAQDFKNSINIEASLADIEPPAEEIQKNVKEANKKLAEDDKNIDKAEDLEDADFNANADDPEDMKGNSDSTDTHHDLKKDSEQNEL